MTHEIHTPEYLNPDGTCCIINEMERRQTAKRHLLVETDAAPPRGFVGQFLKVNDTSMCVSEAKHTTDEHGKLVVMLRLEKAGG